jgi:hypothetical protein
MFLAVTITTIVLVEIYRIAIYFHVWRFNNRTITNLNREKQFIIGRNELINNSLDNIWKSPSNLCFRLHGY